jgi:hypothetical protein
VFDSYREACVSLRLLGNDAEFIGAIDEFFFWIRCIFKESFCYDVGGWIDG